jgi:hypothetical protein
MSAPDLTDEEHAAVVARAALRWSHRQVPVLASAEAAQISTGEARSAGAAQAPTAANRGRIRKLNQAPQTVEALRLQPANPTVLDVHPVEAAAQPGNALAALRADVSVASRCYRLGRVVKIEDTGFRQDRISIGNVGKDMAADVSLRANDRIALSGRGHCNLAVFMPGQDTTIPWPIHQKFDVHHLCAVIR